MSCPIIMKKKVLHFVLHYYFYVQTTAPELYQHSHAVMHANYDLENMTI